jgi:uncharacterized membrane protein
MKIVRIFLYGFLLIVPLLIIFWLFQIILNGFDIYSAKVILIIGIKENLFIKTIIVFTTIFIAGIFSKYISGTISRIFRNYLEKKLGNTQGKIVTIEPTREGFIEIGIITKEINQKYVIVFVPTFPSIFTGSVRIVERNKVKFIDITQQDLINFVITAGVIIPQNFSQKLTQKNESGDK